MTASSPPEPPETADSVAVVGGGAAGCITAHQLLDHPGTGDLDVHVIEREEDPYSTLCAEGISDKTLSRFTAFDSYPYIAETFPGARWEFPGDVTVYVDEECYTLARGEWIPAMADAIEDRGGTYEAGTKVTPDQVDELADEHDLVVGADGPGSQVRETIPGAEIVTTLGMQFRVEPRDPDHGVERLEFFTDKRWSPEYAWVFPKDDILNVGILAKDSSDGFDRIAAFQEHRGIEGKVRKREAYPIGFFGDTFQHGNRVLVGCAAGLTNPVTKGGLTAVIHASELMAEAVASGGPLDYGDRVHDHPITSPVFREGVEIIETWSNEDFAQLGKWAPDEIHVDGGLSPRLKHLLSYLMTMAANPTKIGEMNTLATAMGLSNQYSW
jgi:flavin-dependent dehydrogenase